MNEAVGNVHEVGGEHVSVSQAVRRTGVRGDRIFLSLRHGELASVPDDRGFDLVDPDAVLRVRPREDLLPITFPYDYPDGFLSPADAIARTGVGPDAFLDAVEEGRIVPVELPRGVVAFRLEDVDALELMPES